MRNKVSPVVVFAYNRPKHLKKTLKALENNVLACDTDVIIFIDGPKTSDSLINNELVTRVANHEYKFNSVKIIKREVNLGLSKNIIAGINYVLNKNDTVIVLEDDHITSPNFLEYMNKALDLYSSQPEVWHVNGWSHPTDMTGDQNCGFTTVMNCWGWATWKDKWTHFDKNPDKLLNDWSIKDIGKFNLDHCHDFWAQVVKNKQGKLDTWAIFWYATIFENRGLCLTPYTSLVVNTGLDGTGTNSGLSSSLDSKENHLNIPSPKFPKKIVLDTCYIQSLKLFFTRKYKKHSLVLLYRAYLAMRAVRSKFFYGR